MKTKLLFGALCVFAFIAPVHASDSMPKMEDMQKSMEIGDKKKAAQEYATKGKVVAVRDSAIALAHDPVPALKWPAMTMEFDLTSPNMAKRVKPGDTVSFRFVERNGKYIVTHLDKS